MTAYGAIVGAEGEGAGDGCGRDGSRNFQIEKNITIRRSQTAARRLRALADLPPFLAASIAALAAGVDASSSISRGASLRARDVTKGAAAGAIFVTQSTSSGSSSPRRAERSSVRYTLAVFALS